MPPADEKLRLGIIAEEESIRHCLIEAAERSEMFILMFAEADAEAALEALLASGEPLDLPEVLISEMYMSAQNGIQITRALRQNAATRGMFIAIVADEASDADRTAADLAGADCCGPCATSGEEMAPVLACIGRAAAKTVRLPG